ncbi:MAG: alkane 1-monooxygenase [Lysobacterales bacterium]
MIQPLDDGTHYRDRKRYAWLLSLAVPALVGAGPLLYLALPDTRLLWLPMVLVYLFLPVFDYLMGVDQSNPPESAVPALEADRYYRVITWLLVPMLWAEFIFAAWFVSSRELPWHGWLAVALSTGVVGGFCINVGHELGHKREALERWLAKLVLAPTGYGHFYVEHNRGHHRDVATPSDPASSRLGESIYRFLLREMPGAWRRGWALEAERMANLGKPWWSLSNDIVQTTLITAGLWLTLMLWLGIAVLPFLMLASFWANFQLTSANYIEHYGIARKQLVDGRFEPCKPQHSWNSNHIVSNWALFHLQRHSDHHAHATRRYQSLRTFDNLPQLPSGYFGMFLLAYVPPLWFKVMDRRLLDLVGDDIERINFDPARREDLMRRYGL